MTRPIFEPTPERTDAYLDFGQQQLFRRPAPASGGATYSWARRRKHHTSNQSIISGSEINVTLNDFQTSDAAVFEAYDPGGNVNGITVLVDGLFLLTCRLYWSSWPNDHEMTINGIDTDAFAGYTFRSGSPNNTFSFTGGMHCRLQAGQDLYMSCYHTFGSSRNLFGGATGSGGGSFFELVFLGDINLDDRDWNP